MGRRGLRMLALMLLAVLAHSVSRGAEGKPSPDTGYDWRLRGCGLSFASLHQITGVGNGFQAMALSVSSLKSTTEDHQYQALQHELKMSWVPGMGVDWIGLFNVSCPEEVTQDTQPLVRINPADTPEGHYTINISFAGQQYPNGWTKGSGEKHMPGDACLPYWIAAFKKNHLVDANCLKMHPTWMFDHRLQLENMTLTELFFPDTYNSDQHNKGSLKLPFEKVSHFLLTPDSDVWGELIRGIRYFDVDIQNCPNQDKSSSTSETSKDGRCSMNHLLSMVKAVKQFLKTASYEIVILDFHHIPVGTEEETDNKFVSLLHSQLGDYIVPMQNITYNSTLNEVWHTGHNVIVAYNDSEKTKYFL